jgi:hypothetical protein
MDALPSESARPGSLMWKGTAEETEQFEELHRKAGERIESLNE